jgi:hypothetical protein
MGKLKCICDNILSDTCGEHAYAFRKKDIHKEDGDNRGILECEECGALCIEDPIDSCYVTYYIPYNGKPNYLFIDKNL